LQFFKLKYVIFKEGDYFVSQCLNVDVSTFGKTIQEALDNLNEALNLYFEDNDSKSDIILIEETLMGETSINV
jgi:predicted RNase H-like HicB family nuclease